MLQKPHFLDANYYINHESLAITINISQMLAVLGTALHASYRMHYFSGYPNPLRTRSHYYPHFTDEETGAQLLR